MDIDEIRGLSEMCVEDVALEGYEIMFEGFENVPEEHKTKIIEGTLMPMIQRHKDLATDMLHIHQNINRLLDKMEGLRGNPARTPFDPNG